MWPVILVVSVILICIGSLHVFEKERITAMSVAFGFAAIFVLISGLHMSPVYNVWKQGLDGEAALAKAVQTKQIMIQTSLAEKESAQNKADAISIMGQAAKAYPEYRQQEFMTALGESLREGNVNQVIYIPTEAMIPIIEAGKR